MWFVTDLFVWLCDLVTPTLTLVLKIECSEMNQKKGNEKKRIEKTKSTSCDLNIIELSYINPIQDFSFD